MNIDKIKDRIRKLLAIAADDATADGEVTAAMALAERALQEYHLSRADVEASSSESTTQPPTETFGTVDTFMHGARLTLWESQLSHAVSVLVGSVNCYRTTKTKESGTFRVPKSGQCLVWYGPEEDCLLAAELFAEWQHVIATLAIGRFGGFARNDGARYAAGFASSLLDKATVAAANRNNIITPSTTALVRVGSGSLADVLRKKQAEGREWLKTTGVNLSCGSRRRGLSLSGSGYDAYRAGRDDGSRADFTATRKPKLTA